jgi:hypothetical protein
VRTHIHLAHDLQPCHVDGREQLIRGGRTGGSSRPYTRMAFSA